MGSGKHSKVREFRGILRRFERVHRVLMEDRDCCGGLTVTQCHPLLELDAMGEASLSDLAGRLDLDPSTLSRTVDGLVRSGLVDRRPNRLDRRYVVLSLTPKGKETCDDINERNDRFYEDILSKLPDRRRDDAIRLFDELVRTLDQAVKPDGTCCAKEPE